MRTFKKNILYYILLSYSLILYVLCLYFYVMYEVYEDFKVSQTSQISKLHLTADLQIISNYGVQTSS